MTGYYLAWITACVAVAAVWLVVRVACPGDKR